MKNKAKLLEWIGEGKIQKVLDTLRNMKLEADLQKEVTAIAARYAAWKRDKRNGTLSFDQSTLLHNQIVDSLTDFIQEEEGQVVTKPEVNWMKYLTIAGLLIGIFGSIAVIAGFIDLIPTKPESLELTVFVVDSQGNAVIENQGRINTSLGHRSLNKPIGVHGKVNFDDLLPNTGDTILIGLDAEGWEIVGKNTFVFTGEPVHLQVQRDESLGWIRGIVMSRDGQTFIEGAKVLVNTDTSVISNKDGIFKLLLPEAIRVENKTDQYELIISKEGYQNKAYFYSPNTKRAEIRLEK